MSLVLCDPEVCADCGGRVETIRVGQLPLLRHGGYGAVCEDTLRVCPCCGMTFHAQRQEVSPR